MPRNITASEPGHEDKKHLFKTGRGRWGNIRQKLGNSPKLLKNLAEFLDSFSSSAAGSGFFLLYTVYSSYLSLLLTKRYTSQGESSSETRVVSYKGTVNRYFIINHEQPAIICQFLISSSSKRKCTWKQLSLEQNGLNCTGPLTCRFFPMNTVGPLHPQVLHPQIQPTTDGKQYLHIPKLRFPTAEQKHCFLYPQLVEY